MVVYGFDSGPSEKAHPLASSHASNLIRYGGSKSIEEEAFEWVIVQGTISVWYVEAMMVGVERC